MLGKLTALRFLEWVKLNPGGVISLPTGRTPEYFIKWTGYYLENWNSFYYYIHRFYIKGFGLDKGKALLMDTWKLGVPKGKNAADIFPNWKVDLSLRIRHPLSHLEKLQQKAIRAVDQFAMEYEERIRQLGGIGFFLGGIGPDGHIGFNIRGSDHNSTTRLIPINYETAAAAATDLGGMEISRDRVVITIGLGTITYNPTTTAIIIAAGSSKAKVVSEAIQNEPHILKEAFGRTILSH